MELNCNMTPSRLDAIANAFRGKVWAFVPVKNEALREYGVKEDVWTLGVAVANEPGYCHLPVGWCYIKMGPDAYDKISDRAAALNLDSRGLDNEHAAAIVFSTMSGEVTNG